MLRVPTDSVEVVKVATPLPLRLELPILVAPSRKLTVPVGWKLKNCDDVTIAVKVTGWSKLEGLSEEVSAVVVEPRLVLMSTPTVPSEGAPSFATTRSGLPSPFTSATDTDRGSGNCPGE